jgi:hypothetical protein
MPGRANSATLVYALRCDALPQWRQKLLPDDLILLTAVIHMFLIKYSISNSISFVPSLLGQCYAETHTMKYETTLRLKRLGNMSYILKFLWDSFQSFFFLDNRHCSARL